MTTAITIEGVTHRYGNHRALNNVSFEVKTGEVFGLLGPNGGGKTTLFRLLSTLLPLQEGRVDLLGHDLATASRQIRHRIGITFQSPSLDSRLTVGENLKHQAHLYGMTGRRVKQRTDQLLEQLGLTDRKRAIVDTLSGGLKRRAEIAKSLLHEPNVLLLDEPSTGLDPGAKLDLWKLLNNVCAESQVTILVTTHLMDEAEKCNRLGILDKGNLVALGTPSELRESVGGDCITVYSDDVESLQVNIEKRFDVTSRRVGESIRIEQPNGHEWVRDLVSAFPDEVTSINLGKPTLEDVFIDRTGHQFWNAEQIKENK